MGQHAMPPLDSTCQKAQSDTVVDLRSKRNIEKHYQNNKSASHTGENLIRQLFVIEAGMREASSLQSLKYFAVNELRQVIAANQVMLLKQNRSGGAWSVDAVSSLAAPNERSPLLQWLCRVLEKKAKNFSPDKPELFRLELDDAPSGSGHFQYALFSFLPIGKNNRSRAIVFFSEKPFSEQNRNTLARLSKTLAHAWRVYDKGNSSVLAWLTKPAKWTLLAGLLLLMAVPVPLTVLAPVQVISNNPVVISAPLTGVIKEIYVEPNQTVRKDTLLYSFDKTEALNSYEQSNQSLLVAQSRSKRADQAAFGAGALKSELAITKAEVELARIELESFKRRLSLTDVYANSDGIVLFESVEKWIGRPVETGERVMQIADPSDFAFKIDLATDDAIVLATDAEAKIFLDAQPLNPLNAKITRTSYDAVKSERDILVFPLYAKLDGEPQEKTDDLRIGLRGTAQVFGDKVPLWFFIFRKPLSYLRQITGL